MCDFFDIFFIIFLCFLQVVEAIYGFCDIRQFTDTTECLKERIMTFVNEVAEVVHGAAHRYIYTYTLQYKVKNV